jgi:3-oxoacyl-[acyl-carrier protein] reductase
MVPDPPLGSALLARCRLSHMWPCPSLFRCQRDQARFLGPAASPHTEDCTQLDLAPTGRLCERWQREAQQSAVNYATSTPETETVAGEIEATGGRVITIQEGVADADAASRMVVRTEVELGPVSILVNNAGVSSPATLESYDPAAMARMRRVNVDGVIHTIRAVAPGMKERGYGRIINIASNAAIGTALPDTTFYAATKAEVLILTRRFAMELGRRGVTVNAVAPGCGS